MPRPFQRADRLGEQMRRDLAELLEEEFGEIAGGLTSITRVSLSRDLRVAKVYWSHLGNDSDRDIIAEFLQRERGRIRSDVGKGLSIRYIPQLTFVFDPSIAESQRLTSLIDEANEPADDAHED